MRAAHRHLGDRGRDEDPREVPARAGERGVGPAPGPDVRQELPAHLRRGARARRQAAGRGVPAAPRAPQATSSCSRSRAPGAARAPAAAPARRARARLGRRRRRRCCSSRSTSSATAAATTAPTRRHDAAATTARRPERRDERRRRPHDADAAGASRRGAAASGCACVADRAGLRLPARAPAAGPLVNGRDPAGRRRASRTYRVAALRAHARQRRGALRVNGRRARCPPSPRGIGYAITPRRAARARRRPQLPDCGRMSARAGIVVTGTEVLTGRVSDRNGPWLADRLRELGVDLAHTVDRRRPAARTCERGAALPGRERRRPVITSGGLGPTADDLTAEVVGRVPGPRDGARRGAGGAHRGDPAAADAALAGPRPGGDPRGEPQAGDRPARARRSSSRWARRPGSSCRPPTDAAGRRSSCCPGPPRELQPMWEAAVGDRGVRAPRSRARRELPPAHAAAVRHPGVRDRRDAARRRARGIALDGLEITTCLRRGEVEVVTRYEPAARSRLRRVRGGRARAPRRHALLRRRPTVDEQVAELLRDGGWTIATAESCTGGLLAGRLTDLAGLLGVLPRRARRLLQRGEGRAGRRRPGG